MAWTTPRTWVAGEYVTASLMNTHLKDNLNVLKTRIDNDGLLKVMTAGTASTYQNTTTGETNLWSFTLPASTLDSAGEALELKTSFYYAANGNTKTLKFYVGATSYTVYTGTLNNVIQELQLRIVWLSATTGALFGFRIDTGTGSYSVAFNPTWTSSNTVKFTGQGGATGDITQYYGTAYTVRA